jgi:predicted RNase H-like HicB family nuclease
MPTNCQVAASVSSHSVSSHIGQVEDAEDAAVHWARTSRTLTAPPVKFIILPKGRAAMSEIIFEVQQDEADGGYVASALGYGIHTQADSLEELRSMVKEAVDCYFDDTMQSPKIIRLHFVRDELIAR